MDRYDRIKRTPTGRSASEPDTIGRRTFLERWPNERRFIMSGHSYSKSAVLLPALILALFILSNAPALTAAPLFNVRLELNGRDEFDIHQVVDNNSAFNRITLPPTAFSANAGISDTWSIPFESIGTNAFGGGIVSAHAAGFARPGELGVASMVEGTSFGNGQASGLISARAGASFIVDDLILSNTIDPTATLVPFGKIPFQIDGSFFLDGTYGGPTSLTRPGVTHAEVLLQIRSFLQGNIPLGQGEVRASRTVNGNGDLTFGGGASGLLTGYAGGLGEIEFSFTNALAGVPLSFGVFVQSDASGILSHIGGFAGIMDASVDFDSTISFRPARLGTAFDLPPGFTANSIQANIVDNFWNPEPASVPEPASGWLIAAGVLALAWRRARRQRRAYSSW